MKLFFAGLVGGFIGLLQLFAIFYIEKHEDGPSGVQASDIVFMIFGFLVMIEVICVMALSMYRISPWVVRILGDKWEANRITEAKKEYGIHLHRISLFATTVRRLIVMVDAGSFSISLLASMGIALFPFILPKPKA